MRIDKSVSLFYVSLIDEGHVSRISLTGLFDMVKGGTGINDIMLFTEEVEAKEYGDRLNLVQRGQAMLELMETDALAAVVEAIEPNRLESTLEGFGVYTE